MASQAGIRAGRAFVELGVQDKLAAGLRKASRRLKAFGAAVTGMGTKLTAVASALAAPLAGAARLFAVMGDEVAKMSKRTGVSVETLSELRFVASQTGTEFSTLEAGFRKMQRSIYDAGRGLSTQVDALTDLGLKVEDLQGLSPEKQFKLLAQAISQVADPTTKAAIAMALMGRGATSLLPMFERGAAGIEALQREARRLGLTMSGTDAKAAEDLRDAWDSLWKTAKMGVFQVGSALAPAIQGLLKRITEAAVRAGKWIRQNKDLVVSFAKIVALIGAVGLALLVLGPIISGLGTALGVAATAVKVFGVGLSFLVSPIGLVIAATGALAAYILHTTGVGGKALSWLGKRWGELKADAFLAIDGIRDALAAGDMALAAKIAWLGLKVVWQRGTHALLEIWLDFSHRFQNYVNQGWADTKALFQSSWHDLSKEWIDVTARFGRGWAVFVEFFEDTWHDMASAAQKAWVWIKSLFDESVDTEKQYKAIDDARAAASRRLERERGKAFLERETQRRQEQHDEEIRFIKAVHGIARTADARRRGLAAERKERMAASAQELQDARKALLAANATARAKRKAKEGPGGAALPGGLADAGDLMNRIRGAAAGERLKASVRGTFNIRGLQALQTTSTDDRIAKATERTAANTKRIAEAARTGLAFA